MTNEKQPRTHLTPYQRAMRRSNELDRIIAVHEAASEKAKAEKRALILAEKERMDAEREAFERMEKP